MDLHRLLRERLTAALRNAGTRPRSIAVAVNIDRSGRTTRVTSDGDVTVVDEDGITRVYRHHPFEEEND